jgi:tRNA modification GTPase
MQKSNKVLEKANLKMLVANASTPLPSEFEKWAKIADLIIWTHTDIQETANTGFKVASPMGEGIKELIEVLDSTLFPKTEENEDVWITSERQIACIKKAEECVTKALELLEQNTVELAAFEMREARNSLCSLTGEISDESILNTIFSSYCIGK